MGDKRREEATKAEIEILVNAINHAHTGHLNIAAIRMRSAIERIARRITDEQREERNATAPPTQGGTE